MSTKGSLFFFCCVLVIAGFSAIHAIDPAPIVVPSRACSNIPITSPFDRSEFPEDFIFGVGSAAYQYEGATNVDGKGPSIWDNFTHEHPEKFVNGDNGDIAEKFYYLYKDDVPLLKKMGVDAFRFSISWPRIFPKGKISGGVNEKGVQFYKDLIDLLLDNGIHPFVTLFHWDLPQALEDDYRGFLSPMIVHDFIDYADFCFKTFGHRVKYWTTVNEPDIYSWIAYDNGNFAPGRCSAFVENDCEYGDSGREPYIVGHHLLLCHAAAVDVYRKNYQASQGGVIGIAIAAGANIPIDMNYLNRRAAVRSNDFTYGWFINPIVYGEYPKTMRINVEARLPQFTEEESLQLKNSFDFLGINYYTSTYAIHHNYFGAPPRYTTDKRANQTSFDKSGDPIGEPTTASGFYIYPEGLQDLLMDINAKYNRPLIIITENGMPDNASLSREEALNDIQRVSYLRDHLSCLLESMKDGANVRGYFVWTFLDDFEWNSAYSIRYGLHYVDWDDTDLPRTPKLSATWYKNFLEPGAAAKAKPKNEKVKDEL